MTGIYAGIGAAGKNPSSGLCGLYYQGARIDEVGASRRHALDRFCAIWREAHPEMPEPSYDAFVDAEGASDWGAYDAARDEWRANVARAAGFSSGTLPCYFANGNFYIEAREFPDWLGTRANERDAPGRIKRIFTTDRLPHAWAWPRHPGDNATSGSRGNIFFDGDVVYSYGRHFPIAAWTRDAGGNLCILFTTRSYSHTTSKHCGDVRDAIPPGVTVYRVEHVLDANVANADTLAKNYFNALDKASRARERKESYIETARQMLAECGAYCEAFNVANPLDGQSLDHIDLKAIRAAKIEAEKRAKEVAERRAVEAIALWRSGGRVELSRHLDTMLRVHGDNIQTSRGAEFSISEARRVLPLLLRVRETRTENDPAYTFKRDGLAAPLRVGSFPIDQVTREGVHAGCHFVKWEEICSAARLIGMEC